MTRENHMTQFWENGVFSGSNAKSQVFEKDTMSLWLKRRWKIKDETWKATTFSHIHCRANSKSNLAKVVELKMSC
jgi:hypothetical protein